MYLSHAWILQTHPFAHMTQRESCILAISTSYLHLPEGNTSMKNKFCLQMILQELNYLEKAPSKLVVLWFKLSKSKKHFNALFPGSTPRKPLFIEGLQLPPNGKQDKQNFIIWFELKMPTFFIHSVKKCLAKIIKFRWKQISR